MNKRRKTFNDLKIIGCVMVFLALFQTAGCSHLTNILIVNYTDHDVTVSLGAEIFVPKHDHVFDKAYLGGASGCPLKITSGTKTLVARNVEKEELEQKMISDNLLLWEVK